MNQSAAELDEFGSPEVFPSADLEHLAMQLSDDAAFLAAKYPAPNLPDLSRVARELPPSRRHLHWMGAAAAVAAIAVTLSLASLPEARHDAITTTVLPSPASLPWSATRVNLVDDAEVTAPPPVSPAMLYFDCTPPEQEAVLDLFETEGSVASLTWSI